MRKLLALAVAAVVGGAALAPAADPVVTARVRSLNDLTDYAEYLGTAMGQGDQIKQATQLVRGLADPNKGIEGIDPARPIGLYGVLTEDVVNSYAVAVVPVADEKAFLELLGGRLNLSPKKVDGGAYTVEVPNVPFPVFFRFTKKSVYVTVRSADPLADANLIAPADLFAGKEPSAAVVRLFPGRIPEPLKKVFLGQFELQIAQQVKQNEQTAKSPAEAAAFKATVDVMQAAIKAVALDTEEITAKLGIDPDGDDVTAELTVTPKTKTGLASMLKSAGKPSGVAAARMTPDDALFAGGLRLDLPESVRKDLDTAVDAFVAHAVGTTSEEHRGGVKAFMDACVPTLKSGVIDFGVVAAVGEEPGEISVVAEVRVKDGGGIVKALKRIAKTVPKDKAEFTFDDEEVNDVSIHEVEFEEADDLEDKTGSTSVWFGTSEDRLLISIGPDSDLLKEVAKKKAGTVSVAKADLSVARLVREVEPETGAKLVAKHVGRRVDGKDTATLSVTGGDALTAKLAVKGKALRLITALGEAKK